MNQRERIVWLGILGPLRVQHADAEIRVTAGKQRVLLAALLVRANQAVSFDQLADIIWDGAPPPGAHTTVRTYVNRLRHALGPVVSQRIVTRDPGYLMDVSDTELDLLRFAGLCRSGGAAAHVGDWPRASDVLGEALSLWRGEPLADIPSGTLRDNEAPRLHEMRLQAAEWRMEARLHLGEHDELLPALHALAQEYPLRERFQAQLMLALTRCGRPDDALAAYRRTRRTLVEELGVEPAAELQRLYESIQARDPALDADSPAGPARPAGPANGSGRRPGQPRPMDVVPRQLPTTVWHFSGRTAELEVLTRLLDRAADAANAPPADTVVISAIGGTAGVGKTALAVHWAHQVAGKFQDGQLYLNLRGFDPSGRPVAPAEAIRGFLDALRVPAEQIPSRLDGQIGLYRSLLAGKRMLIVLDNARHEQQVRPLLPGAPGCLVVVTSRSQLTGLVVADGAHPLALDVLTEAEAHELLARRLSSERMAEAPEALSELAGLCARLPLALNIAAARAAIRPAHPLPALAAELRDARGRLAALDTGDAAGDVRAVFSWSYQDLSEPAARMFRLLGVHPGPDIDGAAAASLAGLPERQAHLVLGELTRANLIAAGQAPGRFTFHDLLRAYAAGLADRTEGDAGRREAIHRLLDHYLRSAHAAATALYPAYDQTIPGAPLPGVQPERPAGHGQALAWLGAERQVLLAVISLAADTGFDEHAVAIPMALATFFDRRGYWQDCAATQRIALAAAQRREDRMGQACAHRFLARALIRFESYEDGQGHLTRAMDLFAELGDRVGQARSHLAIAMAFGQQDRHCEALGHAEQALPLYEAAGRRAGEASALGAIGWYAAHLGRYEQALACCQRAVDLHAELGNHDGELEAWTGLGYACHHLGRYAEALTCYQRAAALCREVGNRYNEAEALTYMGDTHHAAGHPEAARDAWLQAAAILDDLHHPEAERLRAKLGAG
jgi:DNA-binding SARP family transcriptional activator/tetratricopeptide (TPR) repeat protein